VTVNVVPAFGNEGLSSVGGERLDMLDCALVILFLLGLYTGVALQVSEKVPLTCAPSGFAGLIMLWRRRDQIVPKHLAGLLLVVTVYLCSVLAASDYSFLGKRFTGLLQLTYSLVIAYAMFLTLLQGDRRQIARILLAFCFAIIIGCLLENYAGLRPVSDAVRERLYQMDQVYDADLRDQVLYGRVRPKLFTSEPSAVTFAYTHYCSVWLALSPWRYKYLVYAGLLGLAIIVLPGPTLMLMLLLATPYLLFLAGGERRTSPTRMVGAVVMTHGDDLVAYVGGQVLFAARLHDLQAGKDASFFYRFTGPMLVAIDMFKHHPWAGAGLTGEPFVEEEVVTIYVHSPAYSIGWEGVTPSTELLINYFWLHWIYFGAVWGLLMTVAYSLWFKTIGVPSLAFCWTAWAILGQASGAYVGPTCWAVLLLLGAAAIRHQEGQPDRAPASGTAVSPNPMIGLQAAARLQLLRQLAGARARSRARHTITLPKG